VDCVKGSCVDAKRASHGLRKLLDDCLSKCRKKFPYAKWRYEFPTLLKSWAWVAERTADDRPCHPGGVDENPQGYPQPEPQGR
jgi:hypothetical protein